MDGPGLGQITFGADTSSEPQEPDDESHHRAHAPASDANPVGAARARQRTRHLSKEILAGGLKLYDAVAVLMAAIFAHYSYFLFMYEPEIHPYAALFAAAVTVFLLEYSGTYRYQTFCDTRLQLRHVVTAWIAISGLGLCIGFLTKTSEIYSRGVMMGWFSYSLLLLCLGRLLLRPMIEAWQRQGHFVRNIAAVGVGTAGADLIGKLEASRENIRIIGMFDDRRTRRPEGGRNALLRGSIDDLVRLAPQLDLDEIIIALPLGAEARLQSIVQKLQHLPADLRLSLEPLVRLGPLIGASRIGTVPLLNIADRPLKDWAGLAKLIEDKVLAALLLAIFGLPMLLIALAIKFDSRGPALFVQERFGFSNKVIRVLKFRTMHVALGDATGAAQTVRDDPRVTRVGRLLRCTSLDELPQLINVLRGEMSLVGPRAHPLQMRAAGSLYYEAVREYFMRHRVRPGLTGWAQVHGFRGETRSLEAARRRVEHDLWYIEHWSLGLDLRILLSTVRAVLDQRNAY